MKKRIARARREGFDEGHALASLEAALRRSGDAAVIGLLSTEVKELHAELDDISGELARFVEWQDTDPVGQTLYVRVSGD